MQPEIIAHHHPATGTVTYLVVDPATLLCAIVDPVLDFDPETQAVDTAFVDAIIADIRARDMGPTWILETGLHTAHMSAAGHLKYETGASVCIGAGVVDSLKRLAPALGEDGVDLDGWDFDKLAQDGEVMPMGGLEITAHAITGRLPGACAYQIGDVLFTGDTVLAPEIGTGRCDLFGADAEGLYAAARRFLSLPGDTRLMAGWEDSAGRAATTVTQQRTGNIQLRDGIAASDFVAARQTADSTLPPLPYPAEALRVAIRSGKLPPETEDGRRFPPVDIHSL
ncbi:MULTISPECIES: MBL fold metallo-hydrolase [unclassified Caulobacter]|uniref:MBL fold metallo-hydrolase n=1 Tax=unclassified Caulobacter TaxID=2648921 RepID=UPI000D3771F9|nr:MULTISPECIES: MBL fold metallo-hydrolase [unclassified Caulobacter]PTS83229.1 MBL fold metallo-hydrolase [Caulobacter sp. HMWF009]PTT06672.1 MBL fold metallo-hydrolase [Caulobacter sp. HMWF025]